MTEERPARPAKNKTHVESVQPAVGFNGPVAMADDRRTHTIAEFCRRYSVGRTLAYAEMKAGRLRFCKVGRRTLIRVDDAEAWSISTRQPPPTTDTSSSNGRAV
jgi:hypothetical protein